MYQDYKNVELVKPAGFDLKDRLVGVQRVTKVTKGGRAFGFSAIVVVGDENGVVGQGLGKSKEVSKPLPKLLKMPRKIWFVFPLPKGHCPTSKKGNTGEPECFEACFRRYRSYSRWCRSCGTRSRRGTQCTVQITGVFKPTQCGKSYIRRTTAIEKPTNHCQTKRNQFGKSF